MATDYISAEAVESESSESNFVVAKRVSAGLSGRSKVLMRSIVSMIGGFLQKVIGLISMILGLSLLSTIPIAQFASLGYLLTLSARVKASGQFRSAFRDLTAWSAVGGAVLASWLFLLPIRILADVQYSAILLENDIAAQNIRRFTWAFMMLVLVHLAWAWYRGGQWRHFVWPAPRRLWQTIRQGGMFAQARDRSMKWIGRLNVIGHIWLGMQGFAVAIGWLAIPISIMVLGSRLPEGPAFVLSVFGGFLLGVALTYLPLAQLNFAVDKRMRSGFDWRRVHRQFHRAPIAYFFALLVTLALAVPLYLLKAELIPREATWLPSIIFVLSVLPARILTGWAAHRADRRTEPRHWIMRYAARLATIPIVFLYVVIAYLTQYVSWYGAYSLYEQHAFLLPVPFLGG